MKVTSITVQVKNPERVSIFVDGKYSFSLTLNEILEQKLKQGTELNQADVKRLKKLSDDGKLRARALEWILNRPRSIREFRDYMFRKKADPAMTEALITQFLERGYLNEEKFAQWLTELMQRRGKSIRAIKSELFKKGVDREIVETILQADNNEMNRLKEVIAKKQKLNRYQKDPQKLMAYLVAQGFNWQDVKSVVGNTDPEV